MRVLWDEPLTLRDCAFIRLAHLAYPAGYAKGLLNRSTIVERMEQMRRDPEQKQRFSSIAIHLPSLAGPTLHPALQDLANILSIEADEAFYAEYYPRVPDIDIAPEHVKRIMDALQREMDREATRRKLIPVRFADLPWERQCALAERRRYWYGQFGISPSSWRKGTWSLWRVKENALPVEVKEKFRWN